MNILVKVSSLVYSIYYVIKYAFALCVDVYGGWGNFSECSVTCGNGTRFRTRSCTGDCKDPTTEYEDCDMGCCPGKDLGKMSDH